jgi:hypothetical protein
MEKSSEYRRLAEECRLLAKTMHHGAQGVMLAVAAVWEKLAEDHAEHTKMRSEQTRDPIERRAIVTETISEHGGRSQETPDKTA